MTVEGKHRSPYVRVWLITMMLLNVLGILANLVRAGAESTELPGASPPAFLALIVLSVASIGFLIVIWKWRRWGFYALGVTTLLAVAVNAVIGMPPIRSVIGMGSYFALYMLLRAGDGNSAWSQLE